jgi:hypothetical protein
MLAVKVSILAIQISDSSVCDSLLKTSSIPKVGTAPTDLTQPPASSISCYADHQPTIPSVCSTIPSDMVGPATAVGLRACSHHSSERTATWHQTKTSDAVAALACPQKIPWAALHCTSGNGPSHRKCQQRILRGQRPCGSVCD